MKEAEYNKKFRENQKLLFDKLVDYDKNRSKYYLKKRLLLMMEYVPQSTNIRILDFGCGTGEFMDYLIKLRYKNVYGCDISSTLINIAKKKGLQVKLLSTKDDSIPYSKKFDFIIMADVIEHLPNPRKTLIRLSELMTKKV